jgi:hypothetical protein
MALNVAAWRATAPPFAAVSALEGKGATDRETHEVKHEESAE